MDQHSAVVTLWFVSVADVATLVAADPRADRGYGRKYLAQLNPALPITPIGQFSLTRSAPPSEGEYYIAGYPGVSVVSTVIEDARFLSKLDEKLLASIPASDVYAFARNTRTGFGGAAHWRDGQLRRSLCCLPDHIYEDEGLPERFEQALWAGDFAPHTDRRPIDLPFFPATDLVREAELQWLGVAIDGLKEESAAVAEAAGMEPDREHVEEPEVGPLHRAEIGSIEDAPNINVVGYATDGRPEPKIQESEWDTAAPCGGRAPSGANVPGAEPLASRKVQRPDGATAGVATRSSTLPDYDDYEAHAPAPQGGGEFTQLALASAAAAKRVGRGIGRGAVSLGSYLKERLRHSDRDRSSKR